MNLSKSKIFLYCNLFFILGVCVASFMHEKLLNLEFLYFFLILLGFLFVIIFRKKILSKKYLVSILFFSFCMLGIWRYTLSKIESGIVEYENQKIEFIGTVCVESQNNKEKQKVVLDKLVFKYPLAGKILVNADLYPKYEYGDILRVVCRLQLPKKVNGFAYDRYLALDNIYAYCYYPKIEKIGEKKNILMTVNYSIKNKVRDVIEKSLGEPEAGLTEAIILGDKHEITGELKEKFSKIGLSHIIAISGMHISILIVLMSFILLNLGFDRRVIFYILIFFLFAYILLIGNPTSALRAGLMGFFVLYAIHIGRLNKIFNALVCSAVILLLINPRLLRDDVGFQLSFLSVLGILLYSNCWGQKFSKQKYFPKYKVINQFINFVFNVLVISIVVQIFIGPIILYNFGSISLLSPISNLLVLWILPILLSVIICAIILSLLFPFLNIIIFLPVSICWQYILLIVNFMN